jgi:hypothetical protein
VFDVEGLQRKSLITASHHLLALAPALAPSHQTMAALIAAHGLSVLAHTELLASLLNEPVEPLPRILGAVSTSCTMDPSHLRAMVRGLASKCRRTSPQMDIVVNLFNAPLDGIDEKDYATQARLVVGSIGGLCHGLSEPLPSCVRGVARVRGFKM